MYNAHFIQYIFSDEKKHIIASLSCNHRSKISKQLVYDLEGILEISKYK